MFRRVLAVIFSLVLSLLLLPASGLAIPSFTWQNIGDGDWQLPANWTQPDPLHPICPGYGHAAFINNGSEVTVSRGEGITQLNVASNSSVKITNTLGLNTAAGLSPAYIHTDGIIRLGGPGLPRPILPNGVGESTAP